MAKLHVQVAVVGLPRYFNTVLPKLVGNLKRLGDSHLLGFFWAYRDANIPRTGSAVHLTPTTEEDWSAIRSLAFDGLTIEEPLQPPKMSNKHLEHPQVDSLKLSPNPAASFSWLTAISKGASILGASEGSMSADFWLIVRPDLRISRRAVVRLLRNLSNDKTWTPNSVAVAARPYAHKVLNTQAGISNLPIDHFFIGAPQAILALAGITDSLNRIQASQDLRQPLVNEFLIGQFFEDHGLEEFPVRLPYLIWRGSLIKSVFAAAARTGPAKVKAGIESIIWNLRGMISPGLHKRGI